LLDSISASRDEVPFERAAHFAELGVKVGACRVMMEAAQGDVGACPGSATKP
jgi:hypothetical protein